MPKPPGAIKLRLRGLSCNGLNVTLSTTEVLFTVLLQGIRLPVMAKDDGSALRDEIQELQEEAAALTERAKKTARHAEVLAERIKHLQTQITKKS
jgi:hypothetical protein